MKNIPDNGFYKVNESAFIYNVGIYGNSGAGKTTFLYHLLKIWDCDNCIVDRSEECNRFFKNCKESIDKYGKCESTFSDMLGINVKVILNGKDFWFNFRDLRGEELKKEVVDISNDSHIDIYRSVNYHFKTWINNTRKYLGKMLSGDNELLNNNISRIDRQINECNCLLFFINPNFSETKEIRRKHLKNQKEEIGELIKRVLNIKQNKYFPILYLKTHYDLWVNDSVIITEVRDFDISMDDNIKKIYNIKLDGVYPEELVNKDLVFMNISNIQQKQPTNDNDHEKVIDNLKNVVESVIDFEKRKNIRTLLPLIGAGIIGFLLFLFIIYIALNYKSTKSDFEKTDPKNLSKKNDSKHDREFQKEKPDSEDQYKDFWKNKESEISEAIKVLIKTNSENRIKDYLIMYDNIKEKTDVFNKDIAKVIDQGNLKKAWIKKELDICAEFCKVRIEKEAYDVNIDISECIYFYPSGGVGIVDCLGMEFISPIGVNRKKNIKNDKWQIPSFWKFSPNGDREGSFLPKDKGSVMFGLGEPVYILLSALDNNLEKTPCPIFRFELELYKDNLNGLLGMPFCIDDKDSKSKFIENENFKLKYKIKPKEEIPSLIKKAVELIKPVFNKPVFNKNGLELLKTVE